MSDLQKWERRNTLYRAKRRMLQNFIATYERERGKNCRKYKCRYIQHNGNLGDIPVRIFLIKYGRNSTWNVLLTTDTTMSFIKAFEVYQIRWNIEVIHKISNHGQTLFGHGGRSHGTHVMEASSCLYRTHSSHFRRNTWDDAPTSYGYNQRKRQRDEQNPYNG